VSPQAVMNSEEALASPLSAWIAKKAGSTFKLPWPLRQNPTDRS
jgi:hypothetical protein